MDSQPGMLSSDSRPSQDLSCLDPVGSMQYNVSFNIELQRTGIVYMKTRLNNYFIKLVSVA